MDHEQLHPRPYLFTLRLWQEELGQGQVEWRGRVQNVAGGETAFFRDWPGLVATLQRLVATTGAVREEPPDEALPEPAARPGDAHG